MRRDVDRTEIPPGSAYNMVDFIPDEIQAVTGGRGGWTYPGGVLGGHVIREVGFYPDSSKVIALSQDATWTLWNVVAGTSIGTVATVSIFAPPFYHRGKLIYPNQAGNAFYYDGSTIGSLTSPTATYGCVYKDRSVLANDNSTHKNRVWFSAAGDPTTWDTTYGWWDTTGAVTGVAAAPNAILVFHGDSIERLRGATPPPGSDMVLEPFFNDGCIDAHSIAYWNQNVLFCSSRGVFVTNGISVVDLTAAADMKTYWNSIVSGYSSSGNWRISGGIYRDHYIVSINNNGTLVDTLCVNLDMRTMWRLSNINAGSMVNVTSATQERLYAGQWVGGTRVIELSSLWNPSASVKQDGDGTNPTPIVETGMFRGYDRLRRRWIESMGKQKWRFAYIDHDLRDAASDNPTQALSYCTDPAGSYTQAGLTMPATTKVTRVRRSLSPTQGGATRSQMMGLKLAVTGPYASAKLYTLEADFEPIDIGSL